MSSNIIIRNARLTDTKDIAELINQFANDGMMLKRSTDSVIKHIRDFVVATDNDMVIGCCAVTFFTVDLAEVRSLAVADTHQGKNIGRMLVKKAEEVCSEEGVKYVFALTRTEPFFARLGYKTVDKAEFPQKIWRDCSKCPKIMECDEVAMRKQLD